MDDDNTVKGDEENKVMKHQNQNFAITSATAAKDKSVLENDNKSEEHIQLLEGYSRKKFGVDHFLCNVEEESLGETSQEGYEEGGFGDRQKPGKSDMNKYRIRPNYVDKFRPAEVRIIIEDAMKEIIEDKTYAEDHVKGWLVTMTQTISERVKKLNFIDYKLITNVTIGEFRGQTVISANKCIWDEQCDQIIKHTYMNDSLFCHVIVCGVYFY